METITPSGLIVRDRRGLSRAAEVPQIDPSDHTPNPNDPVGSVGPQFAPGRNVMYPSGGMHAEGWDGWPLEWQMPWYGDQWSGAGAGRMNTEFSGRVTTVANCADLIGRNLSTMPIVVTANSRPVVNQPAWTINPEPMVYRNRAEWMKCTINALLYRGETFQVATHRSAEGYPDRWVAMSPDAIDVDGTPGEIEYTIAGRQLDPADVLHVRHQLWPGRIRGISPLEWAATSLVGAAALERMAAQLATRGGVPWAVIEHPDELEGTQSRDLQTAWVTAAMSREGAPAVLSGGITLHPLTLSPKDMALLDLRVFDEQRVCAAFGVFPFLVGLDQPGGSMVYQNLQQVNEGFWRSTLQPIGYNLSSAISGWALPRTRDCYFDAEKFIQPPLETRATTYATLHGIQDPVTGERAITVAEIRARENFGDAEETASVTSGIVG